VVGDTLYGGSAQSRDQHALNAAPSRAARAKAQPESLRLGRNFLHAARLEFAHPITGKLLELEAPLPQELTAFLDRLESPSPEHDPGNLRDTGAKRMATRRSNPVAKIRT
jgi:hypothetical protein